MYKIQERRQEDRTERKENKNTRLYGGKVTLKFWINPTLSFFVFFEVNKISLSQLFVSILCLFYFSFFHKIQFSILKSPNSSLNPDFFLVLFLLHACTHPYNLLTFTITFNHITSNLRPLSG